MTDQQIIQAALEAGLCFPECWALTSPSNPTEDISDFWGSYEQGKMQTLRRFAELIKPL
jgi:hypothetical protein